MGPLELEGGASRRDLGSSGVERPATHPGSSGLRTLLTSYRMLNLPPESVAAVARCPRRLPQRMDFMGQQKDKSRVNEDTPLAGTRRGAEETANRERETTAYVSRWIIGKCTRPVR